MAASYGCLEVITPPGADSVVWAQHVNSNGSCFLMYGGFLRKLCARNGWFVMENPIKMDDLEVSPILGNPIFHGMIWGWFPYFQTNPYSSRKISWTIMIFKYRQPLAHRVLLFWHKKNSQLSTLKLLYIRKSRHVHPLPGKSPSSLGLENCRCFLGAPTLKKGIQQLLVGVRQHSSVYIPATHALIDVDGGHQNAGIGLLKEGLSHLATSSGETRWTNGEHLFIVGLLSGNLTYLYYPPTPVDSRGSASEKRGKVKQPGTSKLSVGSAAGAGKKQAVWGAGRRPARSVLHCHGVWALRGGPLTGAVQHESQLQDDAGKLAVGSAGGQVKARFEASF